MGKWSWKQVVVSLIVLMRGVLCSPESALVTELPGFTSEFPSKHYAGYITVNEENGRQLYYYFVTSESGTPTTDPVVLWLNGGPGCSSFDGFIYEHGPFSFEPASGPNELPKLHVNPYSWSKVSNILYLDSPAGVGFSYSNQKEDYLTGDIKTASDSYAFLRKWFEEYPEYLSNPLYISGESYAGIYVPTLCREVANGIEAGDKPLLNFKGYIIGNGCTDQEVDGNALVPFVHGMGLISHDLYEETREACNGNYWNASTPECLKKLSAVHDDVKGLNIYDILEPCYHEPSILEVTIHKRQIPSSFRRLGENEGILPVRKRMFGRAFPLRINLKDGFVPSWPSLGVDILPCMDDSVATAWLNNPSVRLSLHAAPVDIIGKWELCTDQIIFYHDAGSMIPIHRNLTSKGYRALIFSGDHDMCVPYTGSEAWTRGMKYDVVDRWRPWIVGQQVAGYTQGYSKNLIFATVKGSGHTVPEYKPVEALAMYYRWLSGEPL